jgi:glucose uptake protein GlcU
MVSDNQWILLLIGISTVAFIIPDMWLHMRNPVGASILLITNAICMSIYAYYYHNEEFTNPASEKMIRMIISGILYFVAWMLYLNAIKYEKFALTSASSTIMMFILGGIFMSFLDNKYNYTKLLAYSIGVTAIIIFFYAEDQEHFPIY